MKLFVNRNLSKEVECWKGEVTPHWFPILSVYNKLGKGIKANEAIDCDVHCKIPFYGPSISEISIIPENKKRDDIIGLFLMNSTNLYGYRMLARPDDPMDLLIKYRNYRIFCDGVSGASKSKKFICSKFGIYRLGTCIVTRDKELMYWELTESGWKVSETKPSKYSYYILMDDDLTSVARQLNREVVEQEEIHSFFNISADFLVSNIR